MTRSFVVTSGGRGIGRAVVERLADDGPVINDGDPSRAKLMADASALESHAHLVTNPALAPVRATAIAIAARTRRP